MRKADKMSGIISGLQSKWPRPETELQYTDPWQLLVAVILSAQCTDKRVNLVTPPLFERFPDPAAMARSTFDEVFPYIRSISYPNNKTKHIIATANILVNEHAGKVPRDYEALLVLPGVGRKTANVVNAVLYQEARMPVDTHVFRVSKRLGLSTGKTPLQVEMALMKLIPENLIPDAHHLLILHGRYICKARNPLCNECPVTAFCSWYSKNAAKSIM